MAKKKESLTINDVKRCVDLYKDYHKIKRVNIETIAKELGIKKLDLWEFISNNKLYFELQYRENEETYSVTHRFIKNVVETPMSEKDYNQMLCNGNLNYENRME